MIEKKSVVKNTFYLNVKTIITTIISLITTRIILNALGASDFGLYGTVAGSIAMLALLNSALTVSTQRFMNFALGKRNELEQKQVFNNSMLLHIGLGLLIVFLMEVIYFPLFNGILSIPEDRISVAKILYHLMCVSTYFTIITVPYDALINAHEDFLYYSIVGILESFFKLITAVIIINITIDKLFLYGFLITLISIMMMVIMRIYCRKKYQECLFSPKVYFDRLIMKKLSAFAGWRFIGVFAQFFGNHGSNILMNHFFGTIIIAAKNIGDQVGGQLYLVSSNMMRAFNPVIVKAESSGDTKHMLYLSMQACRFGYLLYLFVAIPFIVAMPFVLELWLTNVPEWASFFCQLQILRILLEQLGSPLYTSLTAKGDIRFVSVYDFILGFVTFFVLWLCYQMGGTPAYHYYVSIIFMVVCSLFSKIILCKRVCGLVIKDFLKTVLVPCTMSTIISFTICFIISLMLSPLHTFLLNCIVSLVVILLFGFQKSELLIVRNSIKLSSILSLCKKYKHRLED